MKYTLEVIRLRRSFVLKPLAAGLLWQRCLPANYCAGEPKATDRYQQQRETCEHIAL